MHLKIRHSTTYRYAEPAAYALQQLRMAPKSSAGQTVRAWKTFVTGGRKEVEFTDQHNNHVELISFDPAVSEVDVVCEGEVDTADTAGVIGQHGGYAPLWYFMRSTAHTRPGPQIRNLVKGLGRDGGDVPRLHALSAAILEAVAYATGRTDVATQAEQAMEAGHGVCQDHAHVFIAAARLMGFPARYVSGYLLMDDRIEQDAGHAWAEAHVDGLGWVGFDVSNGLSPDERYVRVATGLDFAEAAPISGMALGGGQASMSVSLSVERLT